MENPASSRSAMLTYLKTPAPGCPGSCLCIALLSALASKTSPEQSQLCHFLRAAPEPSPKYSYCAQAHRSINETLGRSSLLAALRFPSSAPLGCGCTGTDAALLHFHYLREMVASQHPASHHPELRSSF